MMKRHRDRAGVSFGIAGNRRSKRKRCFGRSERAVRAGGWCLIEIDIGAITKTVKNSRRPPPQGWKFKTVIMKKNAMR